MSPRSRGVALRAWLRIERFGAHGLPSYRRHLRLQPEAAGGGLDLVVVAPEGGQLGANLDQIGAVYVLTLDRPQFAAVAGDRP